jgi:hypothetical protein
MRFEEFLVSHAIIAQAHVHTDIHVRDDRPVDEHKLEFICVWNDFTIGQSGPARWAILASEQWLLGLYMYNLDQTNLVFTGINHLSWPIGQE